MHLPSQIARHFRELYRGPNMTGVSFQDALKGIGWQQATASVQGLNSIAALLYHVNYYVRAVARVLEGGPLDAHDKYSFELPPITSQQGWEQLLRQFWADADRLALLMEHLPETQLEATFSQKKYGSYYRNLMGVIEHSHYHLGQISLIRKMLGW